MSADSDAALSTAADSSRPPAATQRKPRFALFIATACGLGYLPVAPGTWGSLAGVLIWVLTMFYLPVLLAKSGGAIHSLALFFVWAGLLVATLLAAVGVWASDRAAKYSGTKDPQFVVIDEVSGQHLALFLGIVLPTLRQLASSGLLGLGASGTYYVVFHLSLKSLLLGFILFRAFDIWKPFPARQAESLPGGWGIMADDWVAGVYAAIGLWLARAAGL